MDGEARGGGGDGLVMAGRGGDIGDNGEPDAADDCEI
jgi:hypothetical protein